LKFRRFSVSVVILLVLVLSAGITVSLISAKNQGMESNQSSSDIVAQSAGPSPTSAWLHIPEAPEKSDLVVMATDRPSVDPPQVEGESSQEATVYTWQDGDRTRRVLLQDDLVVHKTGAPDAVVIAKAGETSIVLKNAGPERGDGPVFRSESGGTLMTLPGGVLLKLDSSWDQETVEEFLAENGIDSERVSPLGFIENVFLVETEPGFASLDLANFLAVKEGVEISSPDWWMDVEAK